MVKPFEHWRPQNIMHLHSVLYNLVSMGVPSISTYLTSHHLEIGYTYNRILFYLFMYVALKIGKKPQKTNN
jgi:hypothetical protein